MPKQILAIETSCDETAASLCQYNQSKDVFDFEILSNIVASQIDIHKKYGGVFPELASRAHLETMIPVIEESLPDKKLDSIKQLDFLAVTQGPGLIGSLLMGNQTVNIISNIYDLPIIPVHHLEGHIYAAFCGNVKTKISDVKNKFSIPKEGIFPILALVVSGGHTSLILMKDHLDYQVVGQTIDDAAGEAFDKVAKIMNLGYPGGPIIEKLANFGKENIYKLPIAIKNSLNFSFSGLKTAVLYLAKDVKTGKPLKYNKADLAASFQKTVVDALILKTQKAIQKYNPKTVVLSGGVSANGYLRDRFASEISKMENGKIKMENFLVPPKSLSTDNAVGIAIAAALKKQKINFTQASSNLKLT